MNRFFSKTRLFALQVLGAIALTLVAAGASAQDTTTTDHRPGVSQYQAEVRNAQIVYVEGNDLVLKLEDGKVEHLVVPSDEKFTVNGQDLTVSQLKSGTRLTQTILTTTTPHYVKTIRVLKGKVWHVNAPGSIVLSLPDGTNHLYKVPSHAKFFVNGKPKSVFDVRKGMKLEATIVTDETYTVAEQAKSNVGRAPAIQPLLGVLLIQPAPMPRPVDASVTAEHADAPVEIAAALPETASSLPLTGALGFLGIASSIGLGLARKRAAGKI
ncbi:MAG TPA: hypothetical protein VGG56_15195 [Terracidiphilus sp.]|jgi:hypothetical protein